MPDDTTPHGGEAMHAPPDRAKIPEPKPGAGQPPSGDVKDRPTLPGQSEPMAADVEDEEADPVDEGGPDVAGESGKTSVTRQPGG